MPGTGLRGIKRTGGDTRYAGGAKASGPRPAR